jgi:hypothetical protein
MNGMDQLAQRTQWLQSQVASLEEQLRDLRQELSAHGVAPGETSTDPGAHEHPLDAGEERAPAAEPAANADPDRRHLPRRRGNPVEVLVARPQSTRAAVSAWVIDRSPEGLCLVLEAAIPVGTALRVKPAHRVALPAWFPVEVRNCRAERSIWIVGCQFASKLSWTDLRLFS